MTVIETNGLIKRFGKFTALEGIDLQVQAGEVYGFLGPNGAGKSTVIRVLLDEIRATAGAATLFGLDSRKDAVAIHRRIGYLPSDLTLYPKLTGKECLRFFARLRGGIDWTYVNELAARFDAELGKRCAELSTGNRQKIGLIAALMHKPELVIMDEPNAGLDPLIQHEFQQVVREVVAEGRTVFLSSHTLSEVQRVADRVGIIRQGRMVAVEEIGRLLAVRRVVLVLDGVATRDDFAGLTGVTDLRITDKRVTLGFAGELGVLLDAVGKKHHILDMQAADADLEEFFLAFYQEQK
ncbi:ABC transporter ATP-binding protein [Tessaracoccus sp. OH4464_COT-324]|uniref:ABC transporter ATP-binding protein n=1 Tax=Tessaracoccus sp. OH4464_COT-324 TaxID=2491059 RepID=UPI000F6323A6|nr:ABC transporter ATP-binding protein [Tessaracoccus sp. OH4464_COT-324]RRD46621.1 ABC transporter ATP-binding protein [Tessaracoccus sp. OH4464_COT-324]